MGFMSTNWWAWIGCIVAGYVLRWVHVRFREWRKWRRLLRKHPEAEIMPGMVVWEMMQGMDDE